MRKKKLKLESNKSNSSHMHDEVVDKVFNKKESPQKKNKKILLQLSEEIIMNFLCSIND